MAEEQGTPSGGNGNQLGRGGWRRLLTIPGALIMTALTALIAFSVTTLATRVSEQLQSDTPLSVTVEQDPARIAGRSAAGQSAMIPRDVRTTGSPGPLGCNDFYRWVHENQGVDGNTSFVQVVLQGNVSDAVLVTGLRVDVRSREPALRGIPVTCPTAGTVEYREVSVDLDAVSPKVSYPSDQPPAFGVTIKKGESEVYSIVASARQGHYRWVILIDLVVRGEARTLEVNNTGRPFETTAMANSGYWSWNYVDAWDLWWDDEEPPPPSSVDFPSSVPAGTALLPLP
jgi:hypothetical protein